VEKNDNILRFPERRPKAPTSMIIFQLGDDRVAIRWEIEVLPPPAPVLSWKPAAKKAKRTS